MSLTLSLCHLYQSLSQLDSMTWLFAALSMKRATAMRAQTAATLRSPAKHDAVSSLNAALYSLQSWINLRSRNVPYLKHRVKRFLRSSN